MDPSRAVLSRSEVDELLKSVLIDEDITNGKITISSGSNKGDGYLSFLTNVLVEGDGKTLHFVIKCAPKNEEFRNLAPIRDIFVREIFFYEELYPILREFQEKRDVKDPFKSVVKCYKTVSDDGNEMIVMEDIRECGFRLWDRMTHMDPIHLDKIFKEYGKLHAISYAMKDQTPDLYRTVAEQLDDVFKFDEMKPEMYNTFITAYENLLELFSPETEKEIYQQLYDFKDKILDFFRNMEKNKGSNSIITHGDCWCNNMMFRYEDPIHPHKPTDIRLLDFQICIIASPAKDLSYAFYVSADEEAMNNLDHYLHVYHESLCKHLDALGSDAQTLFPFETLVQEWKTYGKFGFLAAVSLLKIMLREPEEVVDFNDVAAKGMKFSDIFTQKLKKSDEYNRRMRAIALHICKRGFI